MRRAVAATLLAGLLAANGAVAEFGRTDPEPAATLLLPYFEVDLSDPNGENTVLTVVNSSSIPTIAHVVLWTDWAIPTLGFEVFLEANGSADINLFDVFNSGQLPNSAPLVLVAQTSGFVIVPPCSPAQLAPDTLVEIGRAHRGLSSSLFSNRCGGHEFGDRSARGFITIDNVDSCTTLLPTSPGYFGESAVALGGNVLWGTFAQIHRADGTSAGSALVPIEAAPFAVGSSFYDSFADSSGQDQREPLSERWRSAYYNDESRQTDAILWRDPGESTNPQPCGTAPDWYPLTDGTFRVFGSDGNSFDASAFIPFPLATNRVRIDDAALPTPFALGRISINLDPIVVATQSGIIVPPGSQGYLWTLHQLGPGQAGATAGAEGPDPILSLR